MPTRFATASIQGSRGRAGARSLDGARETIQGRSPWLGYVPDIDPHLLQLEGARNMVGLHARGEPGGAGEVLRPGYGLRRIGVRTVPGSLPLRNAFSSAAAPVANLTKFLRTTTLGQRSGNQDLTLVAITGGDGTNPTSNTLHWIPPTTGNWATVGFAGAGTEARATLDGNTQYASMPQTCIYPPGVTGTAAEPVLIWTNNVDTVYMFPDATGTSTYGVYPSGAVGSFIALGCVSWQGRIYFINTSEGGTRHRRRIRWTAVGNGILDPAAAGGAGAGAFDIQELGGEGMRLLPLGDALSAYFNDGVAFITRTNLFLAPNRWTIVSTDRGLLGPHSVTEVGRNRHFGVFRDGFWFLDASGRFQEAGLLNVGGRVQRKWHHSFFEQLDEGLAHRVQCSYNERIGGVAIAFPTKGGGSSVWTYDVANDRIFPDSYTALCFSGFEALLGVSETFDADAPGTFDEAEGPFDSGFATFGQEAFIHGTRTGLVYVHDPTIVTQDGDNPVWQYESHRLPGREPRYLKTIDRMGVEYVNSGTASATVTALVEDGSETGSISLDRGAEGQAHVAYRHARLQGEHVGMRVNGSGDVRLRSLELDVAVTRSERR